MAAATAMERDADLAARMAASVIDLPSLHQACRELGSHLGFEYLDFSFRAAGSRLEDPPCVQMSNLPADWRRHYEAHQLHRFDPVLRSAFSSPGVPFVWSGDRAPALTSQERRVFAQAHEHGVKVVLSFSLPGQHGEMSHLVLAQRCHPSQPDPIKAAPPLNANELSFRVRAFVSTLHQRIVCVRQATAPTQLSNREKDVLSLVKKGGSTSTIAQALGITERTVYEHLATAGSKLGLSGRHRIAQRALELGLLEPHAHAMGRNLHVADAPAKADAAPAAQDGQALDAGAVAPQASSSPTATVLLHPTSTGSTLTGAPVETFEWPDLRTRMNEFALVYQPIVSSTTRLPLACEGLLRWRHPRLRPYFSPASFIPRLEHTGAIIEVGMWVVRRVLDQIRFWSTKRASENPMAIGVNVSPVQINQPGFAHTVIDLLAQAQVPAERLFFEITESQPIDWDHGVASYNLEKLHHHGVRIFLDDFGCGHASITNLHRSRYVHGVKIDASLTAEISREPRVAMIVRSIVRLAEDMGLQVVGEGVETENQLDALRDLGVEHVQGFLFSKGVDADRLMDWTRDQAKQAAERVVVMPGGQTEPSELIPPTGRKRSSRLVATDSSYRPKITTSTRIAS